MPEENAENTVPLSRGQKVDQVCDAFEAALRSGERPIIEDYLTDWSEPVRSRLLKELAWLEIHYRHKQGEVCSVGEYQRRFADHRETIGAVFQEASQTVSDSNSAALEALAPGQQVAEYEILGLIGAGGMGQVYRARHRHMKRIVALKTLPSAVVDSPLAVRRFQREVEAAAHLEHSNIVTAYDAGESGGTHFLVMQFVEGKDLNEVVRQNGPLSVADAIDYILQTAEGLHYAHAHGVIHRDVKPANLLLNAEGQIKILDMGLARVDTQFTATETTDLTEHGSVLGTLDYMSPEQALNARNVDHRTDIYSLGCTLFYLVTGRTVFGGQTFGEKMLAHREHPIPLLSSVIPEIPERLDAALQKMLAKDREDRFANAQEVIEELRACRALVPDQQKMSEWTAAEAAALTHRDGASGKQAALTVATPHRRRSTRSAVSGGRSSVAPAELAKPMIAAAVVLCISLTSLTLAYYAPWSTSAWAARFDQLEGRLTTRGAGWAIESMRVAIYLPLTFMICWFKFRREVRRFVNLRVQSLRINIVRGVFLVVAMSFLVQQIQWHLSLEGGPKALALWEANYVSGELGSPSPVDEPPAELTQQQWYPYATYLAYSLINYMFIMPVLAIFPIAGMVRDIPRLRRQERTLASDLRRHATNETSIFGQFQQFEQHCQRICARYVDVLALIAVAIHFEYWIGRFTLTAEGFVTMVSGWAVVIVAAGFFLWMTHVYEGAVESSKRALIECNSMNLATFMNQHSPAAFVKWLITNRISGLVILSLFFPLAHGLLT
jgi:serine/threonine protein kinase